MFPNAFRRSRLEKNFVHKGHPAVFESVMNAGESALLPSASCTRDSSSGGGRERAAGRPLWTRLARLDDGCIVCTACHSSPVISDWVDQASSMVTGDACKPNRRISWVNLPNEDILSATRDSESMNFILLLKRAFENTFDFFRIVI